jgi:hypothetical protein
MFERFDFECRISWWLVLFYTSIVIEMLPRLYFAPQASYRVIALRGHQSGETRPNLTRGA